MNFTWLKPLLIRGKGFVIRNAPHILMAMGTGGSITAVIFAAKATPAAIQAKKDAEFEKSAGELPDNGAAVGVFCSDMEKLTPWETVKTCGKYYIPAFGMELFSLMCFWGAHGIDVKRQAVLAGLYSTAEQALIEYQKKVAEMIGDKPEKEIRAAVAQDRVDRNPPPASAYPDDSEWWCLIKGQYFRGTYAKIKDAENQANHRMIQDMYISESELFWLLDPEKLYLKPDFDSGSVGWNLDRLLVLDVDPNWDKDHRPVLHIEYRDKDGNRYDPTPKFCMMS